MFELLSQNSVLELLQQACVVKDEKNGAQNNWLTSISSVEKINSIS